MPKEIFLNVLTKCSFYAYILSGNFLILLPTTHESLYLLVMHVLSICLILRVSACLNFASCGPGLPHPSPNPGWSNLTVAFAAPPLDLLNCVAFSICPSMPALPWGPGCSPKRTGCVWMASTTFSCPSSWFWPEGSTGRTLERWRGMKTGHSFLRLPPCHACVCLSQKPQPLIGCLLYTATVFGVWSICPLPDLLGMG